MLRQLNLILETIFNDQTILEKNELLVALKSILTKPGESGEDRTIAFLKTLQQHVDRFDYLQRKDATQPLESLSNIPTIFHYIHQVIELLVAEKNKLFPTESDSDGFEDEEHHLKYFSHIQ